MDAPLKLCRKCLLAEMSEDDYLRSLKEYIEEYPKDRRVSDEEYSRRLGHCTGCDNLSSGMCGICGCYVELRALKPNSGCPDPSGDRWSIQI